MCTSKDIEIRLKECEERYRTLLDISIEPIAIYNTNYEILYVNISLLEMMGIKDSKDIIGKSIFEFIHPDYKDTAIIRTKEVLEKEELDYIEYKLITPKEEIRNFKSKIVKMHYNNEVAVMVLGRNVTKSRRIEKKLEENERRFRSMFDNNPDAVFTIDLEGNFIDANDACETITGYNKAEATNNKFTEIITKEDKERVIEHYIRARNGATQTYEYRINHKNGSIIDLSVKSFPMVIDDEIKGVYGIAKDITLQKKAENQIKHMAYYDTLTGLANRNYFDEYLKEALVSDKEKMSAIMFMDLDRFKTINDTMGHRFGDLVLKEVSNKLSSCIGKYGFVSRYGGDEFLILLRDVNPSLVEDIGQRIIKEFSTPFYINQEEVYITLSNGISFYPKDGLDEETLLKNADIAMYLAKKSGRNNFQYYSGYLNDRFNEKVQMEKQLRKAIDNNEMMLYYQPQIDLITEKIVCMEALIRWNHPQYGVVSPAQFIPLTEETGLIIPIGKWVLETACRQCKEWQETGLNSVAVSVNISAKQFEDKNFISVVTKILDETGLDPELLEIEITESSMNNVSKLSIMLQELKSKGIRVAIDDFGSGYSSLSMLKDLHIDKLKVDKSFVDDILIHNKTTTLIETIIEMGHKLEFSITAEGIEKDIQLEFLKKNMCQYGQGYLFSKPLPLEKAVELGKTVNSQ